MLLMTAGLGSTGATFADPCTAPLPAAGKAFNGTVRYVGDGDGLCVGRSTDPATWIEVRIADFYAPELHEPGGEEAKRSLAKLALGREARCVAGRRSYDRTIARCSIQGRDIGDELRRIGGSEGGRGWRSR